MKQLVKFTNIHTYTKKYEDVSLEIEDSDDFGMQCDVLDECNSAIDKYVFGSIKNATEPVYYTAEYNNMYFNEVEVVNYSTHNRFWEV